MALIDIYDQTWKWRWTTENGVLYDTYCKVSAVCFNQLLIHCFLGGITLSLANSHIQNVCIIKINFFPTAYKFCNDW